MARGLLIAYVLGPIVAFSVTRVVQTASESPRKQFDASQRTSVVTNRGDRRPIVALATMQFSPTERITQSAATPMFVGVASCAAMACHGGTHGNERTEYTTWIQRDRHASAYQTLFGEQSLRIAKRIGIERPDQHASCLGCHGTAIGAPRGPKFAIEDGVACEACHGAAERWLVPHSKPDWKSQRTPSKLAAVAMTDTKDVMVRAGVCVKCHVGEAGRDVNHELIAAGHPALVFELDAYTANMPPHWRETPDKPATFGAAAWAVGQAVSLRQSLELLGDRARHNSWPEFAEFECYSCHHELQNRTNESIATVDRTGARPPGSPVWSRPQPMVAIGRAISPEASRNELNELDELRRTLSRVSAPGADVARLADTATAAAVQWAEVIGRADWSVDRLVALAKSISDAPDRPVDYATAASTTMALGAIVEAVARAETGDLGTRWSSRLRPLIDRLYDDVQRQLSFDRSKFSEDLDTVHKAI